MLVRALGPLRLETDDGASLAVLRPMERRLLAALTVFRPHAVSVESLAEALWPEGAPASARKTIQTNVLRIRSSLGPDVVETVEGGYLRMRFWSTDPSVAVGQPVFTSGQGILPADLLVGWIEEVDTSSSFVKSALVRPAVDVHKLEVVQVVLTPSEDDRGSSAP